MQNPPLLKPGQVSLVQAEVNTGIVLRTNGEHYFGTGDVFLTFDSLADVERFVDDKLKTNPELEFVLYDSEGKFVKMINRFEAGAGSEK